MKNILSIIMIFGLLMLSGCSEEFLDINDDPLVATTADANLLFPEVLVNLSNNRTIEITGSTGSIVQYYEGALTVFNDAQLGVIGGFTTGNTWANYYTTGLKNLTLVERDALAAEPAAVNVAAQAKILKGFIFYNLTALFEDVPFTEAVVTEVANPQFDSQETVLRGIVTMMDEAVASIQIGEFAVTSGDLIYGGNMENWIRFANSLKLKCLMLIANKDQSVASQIQSTINSPLIEAVEQEAQLQYFDAAGDFNPLWGVLNQFAGGINPQWYMGSTTFQGVLTDLNDPRIITYYDESDEPEVIGSGEFRPGATPGSFGDQDDHSIVSANIIRPDHPDRYITASEILLLKAEAIARGWATGGMAEADQVYRQGIMASMDWYDGKPGQVPANLKEAYLGSLPRLTSLSEAEAVEAIQLQIYITDFMRIPEGWVQWRRTKVPELPLPQGSQLSDITRRFPYPPDERGANPNTPSPQKLDEPMWYEN